MRPPYKATEAAKLLNVGRAWIVAQARAGRIPGAFRRRGDSGHWRFDADMLAKHVDDVKAAREAARLRQAVPRQQRRVQARERRTQEWLESLKNMK
jgi:hypothetical protein